MVVSSIDLNQMQQTLITIIIISSPSFFKEGTKTVSLINRPLCQGFQLWQRNSTGTFLTVLGSNCWSLNATTEIFSIRSGLRIKTQNETDDKKNPLKWYIFMQCGLWIVYPRGVCPVSWEALAWQFNHACAHACMHRRTSPDGICGWHSALRNSTYFNYSSSLGFEFNHHHGNRAAAVTHTHARAHTLDQE